MQQTIRLRLANAAKTEPQLVEALCGVMLDAIKHDERAILDDVRFIVTHLEWGAFGGNEAEHYNKLIDFLNQSGKMIVGNCDLMYIHVSPSSVNNLHKALVPLYDDLCCRTASAIAGRPGLTATECVTGTTLYDLKAEMDFIDPIMQAAERIRGKYRPGDYNSPWDAHLKKEMCYFNGIREQIKATIDCKQLVAANLDTLNAACSDFDYFEVKEDDGKNA